MSSRELQLWSTGLPPAIANAGEKASFAFVEYFTATIRNRNTRAAYARAVAQFLAWLEERGELLVGVDAVTIAAYIEALGRERSAPTVKQHLAAIRQLCDHLVVRGVLPFNPAASVRGPRHVVRSGKTPVLQPEEARSLLEAVEKGGGIVAARDRALVSVMLFSLARVSAVVGLDVRDFRRYGSRSTFRFTEKGGKYHEVPAHHRAVEAVEVYLAEADLERERELPLFRSAAARGGPLTTERLSRQAALGVISRAAGRAGLPKDVGCHSMRATGITAYLSNGGTIEGAQALAGHESPRTTKLYDRRAALIDAGEVERIRI